MNILKLSQRARNYYDACRSKTLVSGYEKNVLVRIDSPEVLFVDANYELQPGDYIFRVKTLNLNTVVDLKTRIPSVEEQALKGKFTREEWIEMLDRMNGILHTPGIPPREEIAGEITTPALEEKVRGLSDYEARMLLFAIRMFWNLNDISYIEDFI